MRSKIILFLTALFLYKDLQKRSCLKKHHLEDKSFILNDLSFVNNVSKKFTA
ncbi:unnamed protein product [Haemophilus parainfluenzae T3T1]|uniref:Uncharacterized protein n=1 Tax=Haemophilus parainfluenzae (strain T3T1) TaxID=862965 RepID=A0AB33QM84_HAEP3|nr:unnamed protein product [Haemophilus parainfluenzae T3T1]